VTSESTTFLMASWMKPAWLVATSSSSSGNSCRSCSRTATTASVTRTVFEPASLKTSRPTDSRPPYRVMDSRSRKPSTTVATSRTRSRRASASASPFSAVPAGWVVRRTTTSPICSTASNSPSVWSGYWYRPRRIRPPGALTLAAASAFSTSWIVRPKRSSFDGSTSTWISRSTPPVTVACATPSICSSRRLTTVSAMSFSSHRSALPATLTAMIGSDAGSVRRTAGRLAISGSMSRALSSRSRTFSAAKSMSVPQAKRSVTRDTPSRETLSMRSMPGTAATWRSISAVTRRSTSLGATPGYDV